MNRIATLLIAGVAIASVPFASQAQKIAEKNTVDISYTDELQRGISLCVLADDNITYTITGVNDNQVSLLMRYVAPDGIILYEKTINCNTKDFSIKYEARQPWEYNKLTVPVLKPETGLKEGTDNTVHFAWFPVEGADGYDIEIINNGSKVASMHTKDTQIDVSDLPYNSYITFRLCARHPLSFVSEEYKDAYDSFYRTTINPLIDSGFYYNIPNYDIIPTGRRYLLPEILTLNSVTYNSLTLNMRPAVSQHLTGEITEFSDKLEVDAAGNFVFDKIRVVRDEEIVLEREVTAEELASNSIEIGGLEPRTDYIIALVNSGRPQCDECYNNVYARTEHAPLGGPVTIESDGENYVDIAHDLMAASDGQVFYLRSNGRYIISENVTLNHSITLATHPDDVTKGEKATLEMGKWDDANGRALAYNFVVMKESQFDGDGTGRLKLGTMRFENIHFDGKGINYGYTGSGLSASGNYFLNTSSVTAFDSEGIVIEGCEFENFIRGFIRVQGSNPISVEKVHVNNCLFYNMGYYDNSGNGYAWFASPGNKDVNLYKDLRFTNNTIYDSPLRALIYDGGRNYTSAEDEKWNITVENNTFFNFNTRSTARYIFDLRYIPCVTQISCQRNLFVLAADDTDKRNLYFYGANIRNVNVDGGLTFTVKDNYSVGCRSKHLADDGIFDQNAFSANKNSFGAPTLASGNLGTADDLKVKVGTTPLTATQMFRNPNPRFIDTEAVYNDVMYHAAPADIYNDLRINTTPEVLNHEIVTLGIGDTRWYK